MKLILFAVILSALILVGCGEPGAPDGPAQCWGDPEEMDGTFLCWRDPGAGCAPCPDGEGGVWAWRCYGDRVLFVERGQECRCSPIACDWPRIEACRADPRCWHDPAGWCLATGGRRDDCRWTPASR